MILINILMGIWLALGIVKAYEIIRELIRLCLTLPFTYNLWRKK